MNTLDKIGAYLDKVLKRKERIDSRKPGEACPLCGYKKRTMPKRALVVDKENEYDGTIGCGDIYNPTPDEVIEAFDFK
ncbi:MAG: hypothetical protein WC444_05965 [Candidatus Paceibacterota bacterium]